MASAADALMNLFDSQANLNAAKFGGYGNFDPSTMTIKQGDKLGGLLSLLIPAYQAALPKAPAANMAMGALQAYNVRKYNQQAQQQALMQMKRQRDTDSNNAAIYNSRTGQNISGPFDVSLANSAAPDIRTDNARESINTLLGGGALRLAKNADYDPGLVLKYLGQQGDATNFQNQNAGLGAIAAGQGQSLVRNALSSMVNSGLPANSPLRMGIMDNGTGQPMLSGGVSTSAPPDQIDTTRSPFLMPTDVPTGLASLQRAGLDDAQAKGTLDETGRHNKITEGEAARHNRSNESIGRTNAQAHMISAKKPSGGGSQNPFTVPNAMQNYVQGQINAIDRELRTLGYVGKNGEITSIPQNSSPGLFGLGGHQQTPKEQRAEALIQMRNSLQGQILPGGGAPFGGQSGGRLRNAGQNAIKGTRATYVIPD